MSWKTVKINKKNLAKGVMLSRNGDEFADVFYLRRQGKRVYLSYSYTLFNMVYTETAVLIRRNGSWAWEKEFNNRAVLRYAEYLAVFPTPVGGGFDNRCRPVKDFHAYRGAWKKIISFPVPIPEAN